MAPRKCKGTPLRVFSGKGATLNRLILLIICSGQLLTKYDLFLKIKSAKGFRRKDFKTSWRRIDALAEGGWISQNGIRPGKVQGESILYELTLKGKAALIIDLKSIESSLNIASR